jgi:hypothetical protein
MYAVEQVQSRSKVAYETALRVGRSSAAVEQDVCAPAASLSGIHYAVWYSLVVAGC